MFGCPFPFSVVFLIINSLKGPGRPLSSQRNKVGHADDDRYEDPYDRDTDNYEL